MTRRTIGVLSPSMRVQLARIAPVIEGQSIRYPCALRLQDGTFLDCVYLVPYCSLSTEGENWVPLEQVAEILPSPNRLPASFANQIRAAGESGNGYYVFTVRFSAFRRRKYLTGLVDFIKYPLLTGPSSISGVLPHVGNPKANKPIKELKVHWCVFDDSAC